MTDPLASMEIALEAGARHAAILASKGENPEAAAAPDVHRTGNHAQAGRARADRGIAATKLQPGENPRLPCPKSR